jgi:hypothetical protein
MKGTLTKDGITTEATQQGMVGIPGMTDAGSPYFRNLYDHAIVLLLLLFKRRGWLSSGPTA